MKMTRFLALFLISGFLSPLCAQQAVQQAIDGFVSNSQFANASISFCAVDTETGEQLAAFDAQRSLPTASTAKLFATASALELAGPTYRPQTRFYLDGMLTTDSVLEGNLIIRGGGDPTCGSKYFNEEGHESDFLKTIVDSLLARGIKHIRGAVIADASEFGYAGAPDGWNWSDLGNYYGAGPSGLVIYDNMLRYNFKTGSKVGAPTELIGLFPTVPDFIFHNYVTSQSVSGDNSYIYGAPYSLDRFATGSLPLSRSSFIVKGSIPDPELQFAYEFEHAAAVNGLSVEGGVNSARRLGDRDWKADYDRLKLIYTHRGPSILEITSWTNMHSVNLFAEELLCLAGYVKNGKGATADALDCIMNYWSAKFSTSGLYLNDGSGLSRTNAISARHFCDLLTAMTRSKHYTDFLSTLPVAGESGTLKYVCRGQAGQGKVIAKSGTMSRIKSYAGYVHSTSGKKIVFALIINNYNCSTSYCVDQMEKVFNAMARY